MPSKTPDMVQNIHVYSTKMCPAIQDYLSKNSKVSAKTIVPNINENNQFPSINRVNNNNSQKPSILNNPFYTQTFSYADVAKNSNNTQNITNLMHEIKELNEVCDINQLLCLIKELKSGLAKCQSPIDKIQFLFHLTEKFNF